MEFDNWKWDNELRFSNENFTISDKIQRTIQPFPSDKTLARFSTIIYGEDYSQEKYKIPDGWELLTTAQNDKVTNGYFGAAFWNSTTCQIVISHRGTKLTNMGAIKADVELILNREPEQAFSAATFTHKIRERCHLKRESDIQLTITGHSLGAWLAQITTFTVKYMRCTNKDHFEKDHDYLNNIYPHTVVFESPGCRPALVQLTGRYIQGTYGNYQSLDMLVYLTEPNAINSFCEQVGKIYRVPVETHSIKDICKFLDKKDSNKQKQILVDFPPGIIISIQNLVTKMFKKFPIPMSFLNIFMKKTLPPMITTEEYDESICSLNVFDEYELKFLLMLNKFSNDALQMFKSLQEIKQDLDALDFKIDEKSHTIKANNKLSDTIARIKYKKYKEKDIHDILSQDIKHAGQGYLEIVKMDSELFLKKLYRFEPYYFKDLYGIEKFLKEDDNTLWIGLHERNEYNVDISIINNIFGQLNTYTDNNKYIFITSGNISKFPVTVLNTFDLLITGNFNDEPADDNYIRKLLSETQITAKKIVLISNAFINTLEGSNIKKSEGYGHKIILKHLQDKSVRELLTRENLKFHGKRFSLISMTELLTADEKHHMLDELLTHSILLRLLTVKTECIFEISKQVNNFQQSIVYHNTYYEVTAEDLKNIINNNHQNLYVIQCDNNECINKISGIVKDAIITETDDFEKMCHKNPNKTIYWFVLNKSMLHLEKYYSKQFYITRKLDINESEKNLVIISGPAGSGKSAYVANLQQELHQNSENDWVFFIPLKTCRSKWTKLEYVDINTVAVCILNMNRVTDDDAFTKQMLTYSLKNKTKFKVHLLFDGFDEIGDDDIEQNFVEIVRFLQQFTEAKILITTRTYKRQYLNESFGKRTFCHLKEIEDDDIVNYLTSCLYTKLNITMGATDKTQLNNLATQLLKKAKTFGNISGLPMIIQLIAEVVEFDVITDYLTDSTKKIDFSNVLELYKKLVDNRYRIYFKVRMEMNKNGRTYLDWLSEIISRKHSLLAVIKVFNTDTTYVPPLKFCEEMKELNSVGFIQSKPQYYNTNKEICNPDNFDFIHSTLEYYFMADILVRWLMMDFDVFPKLPKDLKIEFCLIDSLLVQPQYQGIRFFINAHLESNDEISEDQLKLCLDTWKKLENDCNYLKRIKYRDTLFHVCIREDLYNLTTKLLMHFIKCHRNENQENRRENDTANKITNIFTHRNRDDETILFLAASNESKLLKILLDCVCLLPDDNIKKILYATFFKCSTKKMHLKFIKDVIISYSNNKEYIKIRELLQEIEERLSLIDPFLEYLVKCETKKDDQNKINIENRSQAIEYLMEYLKGCEDFNVLKLNTNDLNTDKIFMSYLLETKNQKMETPLHIAAKKGNMNLIKTYTMLSSNVNKRDCNGMTPLSRAAQNGYKEIVEYLCSEGHARLIPDKNKTSPLAHAAKHGHLEITKYLVDKLNVNVIQKDRFNMIPLTWAAKNAHVDIVDYLLSKNEESIDHIDSYGKTPLSHALGAKGAYLDVTRYLLNREGRKASANVCDNYGQTPLGYCLDKQRYRLIDILIDGGAIVKFEYLQPIPLQQSWLLHKLIKSIKKDQLSQKQLKELESITENVNSRRKRTKENV